MRDPHDGADNKIRSDQGNAIMNIHRLIGFLVAPTSVALLAGVLIITLRPEYLIENGSLLFGVASVGGAIAVRFAHDRARWTGIVAYAAFAGFVAILGAAAITVAHGAGTVRSILVAAAFIVLALAFASASILDNFPLGNSIPISTKRSFYDLYWLATGALGVLCDVLHDLGHTS